MKRAEIKRGIACFLGTLAISGLVLVGCGTGKNQEQKVEDGQETTLADHYMVAAQGLNVLEITNVDSIEVTYRTISKQSGGGVADFDLIHGGSAREEA